MRRSGKSRARIDPLSTVAGILVGVLLYVVVRKYIAGTLPEPFESFFATLMR